MAPTLQQPAVAGYLGAGQGYECAVTLDAPSKPYNLLVVTTVAASLQNTILTGPAGFTLVRNLSVGVLQLAMWYREGAPETSTIKVRTSAPASMQVKLMEYAGAAQTNALGPVSVATSTYGYVVRTGQITNSTPDAVIVAAVANTYASTVQQAFSGALARLLDTISPQTWPGGSDPDSLRTRLTIHHAITDTIRDYYLAATLTRYRAWVAIICAFKGASTGPTRMASRNGPAVAVVGGRSVLKVFSRLVSADYSSGRLTPGIVVTGGVSRIGPAVRQYRLGGFDGLLIGEGTDYRVESVEGLGGWEMRTSDDGLPRGDGEIRGTDLQTARVVTFKVNANSEYPTDSPEAQADVEAKLGTLYRALVPQRDSDWDLIWRDPGQPLKILRCRPVNLLRNLDWRQIIMLDQTFALRAVDPRHYSAAHRNAIVPNTPAGAPAPLVLSVLNQGNGYAYPTIRITPTSVPLTRVELSNMTYDLAFAVEMTMPVGSTLTGDMEARATGAPRSVVTVDGQSKYGAWQHPRIEFRLAPGANDVALATVPAGAPVTCSIEYRDTSSG